MYIFKNNAVTACDEQTINEKHNISQVIKKMHEK